MPRGGGSAYLVVLFQLFALQILSCVLASACNEVLMLWKAATQCPDSETFWRAGGLVRGGRPYSAVRAMPARCAADRMASLQ